MRTRAAFIALVISAFVVIFLPQFASAQSTKTDCKPSAVIEKASALKSAGDDSKDLAALLKLSTDISSANIACRGFTFKDSKQKIFGPLDIPDGLYRVTVLSDTWTVVEGNAEEGQCGQGSSDTTAFKFSMNLMHKTPGIAQDYGKAKGCKLILQISQTDGPWTITIEPLQ